MSRYDFSDYYDRLSRLEIAIEADKHGRRVGTAEPYRGPREEKLRHGPVEETDEVVEQFVEGDQYAEALLPWEDTVDDEEEEQQ